MDLKISVVVPTYRRPHLLKRCLESLTRQTFPASEYEIIVVSDGPDDETAAAVRAVSVSAPDIRFIAMPAKKGPAAARNAGWTNAGAAFIAFTDDDCIVDTGWLQRFWDARKGAPGASAYSGKVVVPVTDDPTDYELNIRRLENAEFITANCACTKLALLMTKGFDERFSMAWREDSDLHFRLLEQGIPLLRVPGAVVVHPVRESGWGVSIREQKKSMFNALLYKKYPKLYRQKIQRLAPVHYYVIVGAFLFAVAAFLSGHADWAGRALGVWAAGTVVFAVRRIAPVRKTPSHLGEMAITSVVIPFLSVFWRCYGSVKFRTLFI